MYIFIAGFALYGQDVGALSAEGAPGLGTHAGVFELRPRSVSYTHLDVYTRQCWGRLGKPAAAAGIGAVYCPDPPGNE